MIIPIIFEDAELLIINKPAFVTVNRSETTKDDTIQDWAEGYLGIAKVSLVPEGEQKDSQLSSLDTFGTPDTLDTFRTRAGIVHRLDKETSGVLVLAKTPEAFVALQKQFKERLVEKKYVALAHGVVTPATGEIKAPVGRLPWNRTQFGIVAGGRDSVTFYKRLSVFSSQLSGTSFSGGQSSSYQNGKTEKLANQIPKTENRKQNTEKYSLLELTPHTGRTHQIRVHLKYIGHPIFADFLYAGRKTSRADRHILGRVFLHAKELSLIHPRTGERVVFVAPLPRELADVLSQLKKVE